MDVFFGGGRLARCKLGLERENWPGREGGNLGPLFLVSAWSVRRGISLGQLATAEKSNEITAIPELLDQIDISNAVVTIDAAGCQREIAEKIVDGGGDYILSLSTSPPVSSPNDALPSPPRKRKQILPDRPRPKGRL